jgi:glycosyltransferase involved in cell wall biosynthesis
MRHWDSPLKGAIFPYRVERAIRVKIPKQEMTQFLSLSPAVRLLTADIDAIIVGPYSQISSILAIAVAMLRHIPFVIWYESHSLSSLSGGWMRRVARALKFALLRRAAAVCVPGRMAYEDCLRNRILDSRLFVAPHSISFKHVEITILQRPGSREAEETAYRIVYVGQFIPRKNLPILIEAFSIEFSGEDNVTLQLVGGSMSDLPAPLPPRVTISGFLQYDEIPSVLASSDLLVLPSVTEVWGLVVNEACSVGCPILVSNRCGSAEIVQEGVNGFTFDPNDLGDLRDKLRRAYKSRRSFDRNEIRLAHNRKYNFDLMASAFEAAVESSR